MHVQCIQTKRKHNRRNIKTKIFWSHQTVLESFFDSFTRYEKNFNHEQKLLILPLVAKPHRLAVYYLYDNWFKLLFSFLCIQTQTLFDTWIIMTFDFLTWSFWKSFLIGDVLIADLLIDPINDDKKWNANLFMRIRVYLCLLLFIHRQGKLSD